MATIRNKTKQFSKGKRILMIIGIILIIAAFFIGKFVWAIKTETPHVEKTLTQFLQATSSEKYEQAYSLSAKPLKEESNINEFKKDIDYMKPMYSDFKSLKFESMTFMAMAGQPLKYNYIGEITYTDSYKGKVSASLIKENGEWRIVGININIQPERFKKFQK